MDFLKCPVCNKQLIKNDTSYKCINNHSYDISSKGYVNMLLANQKHSNNPGDNKEMILSRGRFLELNYYHILRKKILDLIIKYNIDKEINFCDLACGEGYYTNYLHNELKKEKNINTIGIDISKYAIIEACKKRNAMHLENIDYVIGNLNYLPFLDNSFTFMLNCFALIDAKEFYRVLKDNGYFIRILPDFDHLLNLKEFLYENVILNEMKEKQLCGFKLIEEVHIKDDILLKNNNEIYDLFTMTPYYYKSSKESIEKLKSLNKLKTRISFVLLVYQKNEDNNIW